MKKAIATVVVLALGVMGYFGYAHWQEKKFIESLTPHVKNASLRTNNALRLDSDSNSKVTWKEAFEKLEGDIAEIDKKVLEIQTVSSPSHSKISEPVLTYVKGTQELLRAILSNMRRTLAFSNAIRWYKDSGDDLGSSNPYAREFALKRMVKAEADAKKVQGEAEEAQNDVILSARKLVELRKAASAYIGNDALVDLAALEPMAKKVPTRVKAAAGSASSTVDTSNNGIQNAIVKGETDEALSLIAQGVNVNHQNNAGDTALHLAIAQGNDDVVKALVRIGAARDITNKKGETPAALAKGNTTTERLLAGK